MGSDDSSHAVDYYRAVQLRKCSFDQVRNLSGIFKAGGVGNETLAAVVCAVFCVLFHFLNDFFNGPLFCPNLSAGDQVSLRIHIQQRTDAEHRADKA